MLKKLTILILLASYPFAAAASDLKYDLKGQAQGFYGLIDPAEKYEPGTDNDKAFGYMEADGTIEYNYNDDTTFGAYLKAMSDINNPTHTLNNGNWGKELYGVADSQKYGQLTVGETFNVAYQFHQGQESSFDPTDFLMNPNWNRQKNEVFYKTLNSTAINTDGVASKISYITPAFANTSIGISYINDINNRRGLVNKQLSYDSNTGYVASIYNNFDAGYVDISSSASYAQFHEHDKEMAASVKLKRGNWSLSSGYRKSYIDGNGLGIAPDLSDNYREGQAWDVGLGFEFGPFKSSLTYLQSQAKNTDNQDRIITFSNKYQVNKYLDVYLGAVHVRYRGEDQTLANNNQAYIFMTGLGVGF